MRTHLFVFPDLPASPQEAARAIDRVLADDGVGILVFWDPALGDVPWSMIAKFDESGDDVWHSGSVLGSVGLDPLAYIQPLSIYRLDPPANVRGAVNWKLDLRASLVRASALRRVGGLDPVFETLRGAGLELGYRLMQHGAVCRQQPDLVPASAVLSEPPSLADQYRLLRRHQSRKWVSYSFLRRLMQLHPARDEIKAMRDSADASATRPEIPVGVFQRDVDAVTLPDLIKVTVVLPTFGRYRYVAEVLDDLRAQTIAPTQILIADGNPPSERQPEVYERYRDLPIEVIWHEENGICSGRNECLRRATGDYVWFVDDDSRFDARNLESHLRVMAAYGADVSVGPAYTKSRPDLHGYQREIAVTFMDCGTTLVKRSLLVEVGGFDMRYNEYLAGEDGELGIRFVRAGALMVNNPLAKRFHYVAPVGGSRTSTASVHRFTRWTLLPRPVQSIYYTAKRYFEPEVAADAMFWACLLAGWRRREGVPATRGWKLKTLLGELAAAPVTALRLLESIKRGQEMLDRGPEIPPLAPADALRTQSTGTRT